MHQTKRETPDFFCFFLKKKEKGTLVYIDQLMQLLYISQTRSIEKYLLH